MVRDVVNAVRLLLRPGMPPTGLGALRPVRPGQRSAHDTHERVVAR